MSGNSQCVYQSPEFTIYVVVDGNQYQFIEVPNDRQKPFTFRNQTGQIVQATPVSLLSAAGQPIIPSSQTNTNEQQQQQNSITSLQTQQAQHNSPRKVSIPPPNSLFHIQQNMLSSNTATIATPKSVNNIQSPAIQRSFTGGFIHTHHPLAKSIPTLIPTKNTLLTYLSDISSIYSDSDSDSDLSLDDTTDLEDSTTSVSPCSQLCEHEQSISKQIKNQAMLEPTGLSNMTTTTINNLNSNTNSFLYFINVSKPIK